MKDSQQIHYIGESILEMFQYADSVRKKGRSLKKSEISRLVDLSESFCALASSMKDRSLMEEAALYERVTRMLVMESVDKKIFETGFFNPFDDGEYPTEDIYSSGRYTEDDDNDPNIRIKRVRMWNNDAKNKVMLVNGKMIAGRRFEQGDIIERCPCRIISGRDLYSKDIRDMAFPIDSSKRIFAIPFGYGLYYRNSKEFGVEPNACYRYDDTDPNHPYIVIVALQRIRKDHEVVLESTDEDFENEIKPGQFSYRQGPEMFYSPGSIKVV